MKNISIKKKFLFFTIFILFYAVFYLFIKKGVGNDTSISEWLINYNGGFTRRGLGGEISIFLANFFLIPLRDSIFLLQTIIHTSYLFLLFLYIRNIRLDIIQIFAIFSPLFDHERFEGVFSKLEILAIFFVISQ